MALAKVVRKGSYQGVSQWGISTSVEITPSRKTAQKWADLENAQIPSRFTDPNYLKAERAVARVERAIRRNVR